MVRSTTSSFLFSILLSSPISLFALTLNEANQSAQKQNLNLHQAEANLEAARARLTQAGRLSNPDFEFGAAKSNLNRNRFIAEFSQALPLSKKLSIQKTIARVDIASAALEISDFKLGLTAEVKRNFLESLFKEEVADLYEELKVKKEELLTAIRARVEAGTATAFELVTAEKEILEAEDLFTTAVAEVEAIQLTLLPLLGSSANSLETEGSLAEEIAKLERIQNLPLTSVLPQRPDYKLVEINIDRLSSEKALAKADALGDVRLGIFMEQESGGRDDNETFGGIRLSFPLPLWNRNQGAIKEKEALIMKGLKALAARELEIKADLQIAQNNRARLKALCAKYTQTLLPSTEKAYKLAVIEYEAGKAPLERLLQSSESVTAAKVAILDCQKRYAQTLVQLEKVQAGSGAPKNIKK